MSEEKPEAIEAKMKCDHCGRYVDLDMSVMCACCGTWGCKDCPTNSGCGEGGKGSDD